MPASYHINENDGLIALTVTGRVNMADVHAAAGALIGDPELSIVDFTLGRVDRFRDDVARRLTALS